MDEDTLENEINLHIEGTWYRTCASRDVVNEWYLIIGPTDNKSTVPAGIDQQPGNTSELIACLSVIGMGGKYLQHTSSRELR